MKPDKPSSNRRLALNMTANLVAYFITHGISLVLSPYIVKTVGVDANGFVGLANNIVSYAMLSTVALNALAGRYISVKIYEKNEKEANRYFSSVFIANACIAGGLLLVLSVVWVYLDLLIKIPRNILVDVKILFAALFFECIVTTIGSVFSVATFVTDKLYLNSIRSVEANIGRAVILAVLFLFFSPNVCYLGISSALVAVYCMCFNVYYTSKLLPFIRIQKKYFDVRAVWELVVSGIWALVIRLGQLLSDGLDLLISNLLINPDAMGILSLAKAIPSMISGIVGGVVGVFSPRFTYLFAKKQSDELLCEVRRAMKIMGIIVNIPIIVLVVCGRDFFSLWQPTQSAKQLQILSLLTCGGLVFSGGINCLYELFVVIKRIKENAIALVLGGIISSVVTIVLLQTTEFGIYAIASISTVVNIVRNVAFTAPFGAKCLGQKWYSFYPDILLPVLFTTLSSIAGMSVTWKMPSGTWMLLIMKSMIVVSIACVLGVMVILNHNDRTIIKGIFCKGYNKKSREEKN